MSKYRIWELAKEYNTSSKVILDILERNKIEAKNHMSNVDEAAKELISRTFAHKSGNAPKKAEAPKPQKPAQQPQKPQPHRPWSSRAFPSPGRACARPSQRRRSRNRNSRP